MPTQPIEAHDGLVSVRDVAHHYRVAEKTVRRWALTNTGPVQDKQVRTPGSWRFDPSVITPEDAA